MGSMYLFYFTDWFKFKNKRRCCSSESQASKHKIYRHFERVCSFYNHYDTFLRRWSCKSMRLGWEPSYHELMYCREIMWVLVPTPYFQILSSSPSTSSPFKGLSNLKFSFIKLFDLLPTWSCWRFWWWDESALESSSLSSQDEDRSCASIPTTQCLLGSVLFFIEVGVVPSIRYVVLVCWFSRGMVNWKDHEMVWCLIHHLLPLSYFSPYYSFREHTTFNS